jgi:cell wall-associated NlpC family hydrolase
MPGTTAAQQQQSPTSPGYVSGDLAGVQPYMPIMQRVAAESGVPWEILAAIMGLESNGVNLAPNEAGAMGLMQVVPRYWQELANQYGGNLMDPYTNIRTAAAILQQNYDTYGSWEKAAAAYFGGAGAFNDDGSYSGNADYLGTDIQQYVNRFLELLGLTGYGNPSAAELTGGGNPATPNAAHAIAAAQQAIGTPYLWGGREPGGFDCSGLMQWAYAQAGVQIAGTAQDQYNTTQRINSDDLLPGDLIFFYGTNDASGTIVTHVGMYLGNGQMLHAPKEGDVVKIVSINNEFWQQHLYGFGRVY